MSFYFAIIGTKDNPIYECEFGTSKQGGDGNARVFTLPLRVYEGRGPDRAHAQFHEDQRPMNQFILHSSLDIVEEMQWTQRELYLKTVDRFNNQLVSCFLTAGSMLSCPNQRWGRELTGE